MNQHIVPSLMNILSCNILQIRLYGTDFGECSHHSKEFYMKLTLRIALMAFFSVLLTIPAVAATKTFMVMPFTVNGPQEYNYLGKAIPSTLASRLTWPGSVELNPKAPSKAPTSVDAVKQAQNAAGADYAFWGEINIVNNSATIDVKARDKSGKEWAKSAQSPVGELISSVQNLADSLSMQVFGRNLKGKQAVNQMNPALVVNETGQQDVYLNPQFRYQGSGADDNSRMRSSLLPFDIVGFAMGDFSGHGKSQIAVLSDHRLYIYDWNGGKLHKLVEHTVSMSNQAFILRQISFNKGRPPQLVVTTFGESDNQPASYIYTFEGGNLREYCRRSSYFLNVVRLAPTYQPTLVGQSWDSVRMFRPGVYTASVVGDRVTLGSKLKLPKGGNVFNFAYMPANRQNDVDKILILGDNERITVYSMDGEPMHQTIDKYSGSSVGMEHYKSIDGLGVDKRYQLPSKYYAPMEMLIADLEGRGEYVLLINKPVSTAAELFDRYRFYPQGEIHALYWDGVGLGLKWKTRRIRGSVVGAELGDIDNDGVLDLVVALNTHPGALGVGKRKGIITAYPLDVSQTNPRTAPDMSDFDSNN